jgi:hypothetical protein
MLSDYRTWLESELALLGNASHHAYAFGQANMAKRAIERLDEETSGKVILVLERGEAAAISTALEMLEQSATTLPPALAGLRERLHVGFSAAGGAAKNVTSPPEAP